MKRVVTGHDESGKSVFVSEGRPPRTVVLDRRYQLGATAHQAVGKNELAASIEVMD
jgi:hypothetical protein